MKYFFAIFFLVGATLATIGGAVVSDVNPTWTHTSVALHVIGIIFGFLFLVHVIERYLDS